MKPRGVLVILAIFAALAALAYWKRKEIIDMTIPRGLRLNNPGNIEKTKPGRDRWQGEIDSPDARFARFATMADGIRALGKLLLNYNRLYGIDTVRNIVNRYSDQAESPDRNAGYIKHVAGLLKLAPDQRFNVSARLGELVAAMSKHEQGTAAFLAAVRSSDLTTGVQRAQTG